MTGAVRWCVAVPGTIAVSIAAYVGTAAALVRAAVTLARRYPGVDVNFGIALRLQHGYFVLLSVILTIVSLGMEGTARRRGWVGVAVLTLPSIAYWIAAMRHRPYWSLLVLASTAAGFAIPLLVSRFGRVPAAATPRRDAR